MRGCPDLEVDADELGVAVTLFLDPEQKMLASMHARTTVPGMALDTSARRN